jgi:hypothetical protein
MVLGSHRLCSATADSDRRPTPTKPATRAAREAALMKSGVIGDAAAL